MFGKLKEIIQETSDPSYKQREYEAFIVLSVQKKIGGDIHETISEVRSIPNVTVVHKEHDIINNEDVVRGVFKVKFVLEGSENLNRYVHTVLTPGLSEIGGLRINKIKNIDLVKQDEA